MTDRESPQLSQSPVFLIGMNGSGTTMLRDCLGRHPLLFGFPRETRLFPHIIAGLGDSESSLKDDDTFLKLWEQVLNIPAFVTENGHTKVPLPDDWQQYPRTFEAVVDAIMRYFAKTENKEKHRWCEKTPQHIQHLPTLKAAFPTAKFVHVIRDGRDSAASFHRRWKRNPRLSIYRWRNVIELGRDHGRDLGDAYYELKYEQLTEQPERYMREICSFLDIPFDDTVLVSSFPHQKDKQGQVGTIEPNAGKWRQHFSVKEIQQLEDIAGACLASLDYPVDNSTGAYNPPKNTLKYWRIKDQLSQFRMEVGDKLSGKSQKRWSKLMKLPFISIKQSRSNRF